MRANLPTSARLVGPTLAGLILALACAGPARAGDRPDEERFEAVVRPILEDYCYGCHGNGIKKGSVSFDGPGAAELIADRRLWLAALKNVRAGMMPPAGEPRPGDEEMAALEHWIKADAFGLDPEDPDPGRVTVRRLNRVEYRNTVRDLLGVDFDTSAAFPPDDTGHGFDTIGDVLNLSPLLLEKYLEAAKEIVGRAVPTTSGVVPERRVEGRQFRKADAEPAEGDGSGPLTLSYYEPAKLAATAEVPADGRYTLVLELSAHERYVDGVFDYNRSRLTFKVDGEELHRSEYSRQGGQSYRHEFDREWSAGPHELTVEVEPLTPDQPQVRSLSFRLAGVKVLGPLGPEHLVRPPAYRKFFPRDVPEDAEGRRAYAREILSGFAPRAFRRPVDGPTADRLADLAVALGTQEGETFESGVAQAMSAVLASPRFLFREEGVEPGDAGRHPRIDEYALASRLSYFLWSTMPDDELTRLAGEGKLRENLPAQVERMLADGRSGEFVRHFVGQWLQARDVEGVPVNAFAVLSRDQPRDPDAERRRDRFRELRRKDAEDLTDEEKAELDEIREAFGRSFRRFRDFDLDGELRRAMRRETEMAFEHVLKEGRSLLELLDADYAFLNERLAKHYGIEGVEGGEMRRVVLPPDSPRGGVLTQGTVLTVTSNPDRTSPVKRGLFILENILGTPPPPPPPDIPSLEEAGKKIVGRDPTLRETLELHRSQPLCMSCHARLDPLGLALENFNALGLWREVERGTPVDPTGTLITGEDFEDVRELKRVLVENRRADYYRCLAEKMLTYALGRGLEYHDVATVDALVERLERSGGLAPDLVAGIIESAPFQKRRRPGPGAGESTASRNED